MTDVTKLMEATETPKGLKARLNELIDELEAVGFDNDRIFYITRDLSEIAQQMAA